MIRKLFRIPNIYNLITISPLLWKADGKYDRLKRIAEILQSGFYI